MGRDFGDVSPSFARLVGDRNPGATRGPIPGPASSGDIDAWSDPDKIADLVNDVGDNPAGPGDDRFVGLGQIALDIDTGQILGRDCRGHTGTLHYRRGISGEVDTPRSRLMICLLGRPGSVQTGSVDDGYLWLEEVLYRANEFVQDPVATVRGITMVR